MTTSIRKIGPQPKIKIKIKHKEFIENYTFKNMWIIDWEVAMTHDHDCISRHSYGSLLYNTNELKFKPFYLWIKYALVNIWIWYVQLGGSYPLANSKDFEYHPNETHSPDWPVPFAKCDHPGPFNFSRCFLLSFRSIQSFRLVAMNHPVLKQIAIDMQCENECYFFTL